MNGALRLTSRLSSLFSPVWIARWKRTALYAVFAVTCLLFSLFLTFPYDAIQQRIETEAARAGVTVKIGSLGPAFFGVTATRVQLFAPGANSAEATPSEALLLNQLTIRPMLFPPGAHFRAKAFGGSIEGSIGQGSTASVELAFAGLDPSQGNLQGFSGLDLSGKLSGRLSMTLPVVSLPGSKVKAADLSQADGELILDGSGLLVNGGTIKVPIGGTPMPVDLPKLDLGTLQARLGFAKGLGTVEAFKASGGDLDLNATGTLKLARKVDYSEPNIDLKLKVNPDTVKRLGLLGSGLSLLPSDRSDPTTKSAHLSGYLGNPRFAPGSRN